MFDRIAKTLLVTFAGSCVMFPLTVIFYFGLKLLGVEVSPANLETFTGLYLISFVVTWFWVVLKN